MISAQTKSRLSSCGIGGRAMNNSKIVFISGAISGDPDYKAKFAAAEKLLTERGYIVLNPTVLPEKMPYEKLMEICFSMIDAADAVYFLEGWKNSPGSLREYAYARVKHKDFFKQFTEGKI